MFALFLKQIDKLVVRLCKYLQNENLKNLKNVQTFGRVFSFFVKFHFKRMAHILNFSDDIEGTSRFSFCTLH